ncbi:MAG: phosphodiester glycosidase family protein [Bacteroidales bacterium]|nr:phosphodiester glycosidase family protein [Bacteroidales bacterium]
MRKLILAAIALAWSTTLPAQMQMLREDPDRSGVNTHVYEFKDDKVTPAPKGYSPFYLVHYGRHGSRTDSKTEDYTKLESILQKAKDGGYLSASGDSLLAETRQVMAAHGGNPGHLTRNGELEERELARRVFNKYKPVFTKGSGKIHVQSSNVPRVLVSMACFTGELSKMAPKLDFTIETGEAIFAWINNSASKEHKEIALALRDSMIKVVKVDSTAIYERLFTNPAKGKRLAPDADKLQRRIWRVAKIAKSSGLETSPYRFLPDDVICKWWDITNRNIYFCHGNSIEFGEERMKRAVPLVEKVFGLADDAIASGSVAADLLFGHDYPLLAMASWFGLEGIGDRMSFDEIPQKWNDPTNITLASNMQIVFYKSKKKGSPVLVKFVYNGRERKVRGLEPVGGVYYKWEDIKSTYGLSAQASRWNWKEASEGVEYCAAQVPLFGRTEYITAVRYDMRKHKTHVLHAPAAQADSTSALALRMGAVAAINGSYFNVKTLEPVTYVWMQDSGVLGKTTAKEASARTDGVLAIKADGEMAMFPSDSTKYGSIDGYTEILAAGPVLLQDGKPARDVWPDTGFYVLHHPRSLVGTDGEGRAYLIVIDGRFPGQGEGASIDETVQISLMFGLKEALNLDGGGSCALWTEKTEVLSHPYDNHKFDHYGQRVVPNILYIK